MDARAITPVQRDLLRLFEYDHSDEFAKEIREVLSSYFRKKLDEETDRLWDEGILDEAALETLRHEDFHKR